MNNTKTIITQATNTKIDNVTGEVLSTEEISTTKIPQTPDFFMTFTQDIGFIANVSGGASKLLFGILSEISRSNTIVLVKEIKDKIAAKVGLNPSSINPLITNLVKNNVLLREKNNKRSSVYMINPYYFGKGKWVNINKLRMLVEYDFVNGKKTFGVETEYIDDKDDYIGQLIEHKDMILEEVEKIRKSNPEIIEAKPIEEDIKEIPQNKTIPKNETITDTADVSEIKILKLKMQAELAEKEKIEAENERLRLKIELAKISKTKAEPSLFDIPSSDDKDF
ncbi:hypothetical protein [Campylobacter sp. CCUG 57310]|uniref:hypothetical protein n=1 Tax=Campylobacter sp. CCUG 57310 TaxID=2517362 RepID=UPI0015638BB3|nr:hypothetical protein [Campylobacter sp. CCUG 57310]QKF93234.1 hypothetical protein CORI_a048 [Campylobacter sp. CCUG 57310]